METKGFYIGEAVAFGWKTMAENLGFFIGLLIVCGVLWTVPAIIAGMAMEANVFLGFILHIADWVLTIIISMGLVKIALRFCNNE